MNKIYRLKFSKRLQQLIVVSDIAKGYSFSSSSNSDSKAMKKQTALFSIPNLSLFAAFVSSILVSQSTFANGLQGMEVISGKASMEVNGIITTIKNSPNTIINWQQFNINKGDMVEFIQENKHSSVFNKVTSSQLSQLNGTLKSNGQVFLINPNGIVFGKDAVIDTSSFVASTLNLSNDDIKKGKLNFEQAKDKAIAEIINNGLITVSKDGTIGLVGGSVTNNGKIKVENGNVLLAAGQKITISDLANPTITYSLSAPKNEVLNLGEVFSKNGKINLSGGKIANKGKLKADSSVKGKRGEITISSKEGDISLNGEISSQGVYKGGVLKVTGNSITLEENAEINLTGENGGGTAYIGGDESGTFESVQKVDVKKDAKINVSAIQNGNGGTAIVSGNIANIAGEIKAVGGKEGGDGGFIETSYKDSGNISNQNLLDVSSSKGVAGAVSLGATSIDILGRTDPDDYCSVKYKFCIRFHEIENKLNVGGKVILKADYIGFWDSINVSPSKAATLKLVADKIYLGSRINVLSGTLNLDLSGYVISRFGSSNSRSPGPDILEMRPSSSIYYFPSGILPVYTSDNATLNLNLSLSSGANYDSYYDGCCTLDSILYGNGNVTILTKYGSLVPSVNLKSGNILVKRQSAGKISGFFQTQNGNVTVYAPNSDLGTIWGRSAAIWGKNVQITAKSAKVTLINLDDHENRIFETLRINTMGKLDFSSSFYEYSDRSNWQVSADSTSIKPFKTDLFINTLDKSLAFETHGDTKLDIGILNRDDESKTTIFPMRTLNVKVGGRAEGSIDLDSVNKFLLKADSINNLRMKNIKSDAFLISKNDVNFFPRESEIGNLFIKSGGRVEFDDDTYFQNNYLRVGKFEVKAKDIYFSKSIYSSKNITLDGENIYIKSSLSSIGDLSLRATDSIRFSDKTVLGSKKGIVRLFEGKNFDEKNFSNQFPDYESFKIGERHPLIFSGEGVYLSGNYPEFIATHGDEVRKYNYIDSDDLDSSYIRDARYRASSYLSNIRNIRLVSPDESYLQPTFVATSGEFCINSKCSDGSILKNNSFEEMEDIQDPWDVTESIISPITEPDISGDENTHVDIPIDIELSKDENKIEESSIDPPKEDSSNEDKPNTSISEGELDIDISVEQPKEDSSSEDKPNKVTSTDELILEIHTPVDIANLKIELLNQKIKVLDEETRKYSPILAESSRLARLKQDYSIKQGQAGDKLQESIENIGANIISIAFDWIPGVGKYISSAITYGIGTLTNSDNLKKKAVAGFAEETANKLKDKVNGKHTKEGQRIVDKAVEEGKNHDRFTKALDYKHTLPEEGKYFGDEKNKVLVVSSAIIGSVNDSSIFENAPKKVKDAWAIAGNTADIIVELSDKELHNSVKTLRDKATEKEYKKNEKRLEVLDKEKREHFDKIKAERGRLKNERARLVEEKKKLEEQLKKKAAKGL